MKKWDWGEMFGEDFLIEIKNEERKYFGLEEIDSEWQTTVYYSKTNLWHKRLVVFWNGNAIVKVIDEEKRVLSDGRINYESHREFDTYLLTEDRELILPLTSRGKKKKVSYANVLAIMPFGCSFYFCIDSSHNSTRARICVNHPRNCQVLAIGEEDKISKIRNNQDFRGFLEEYIATCPDNYFDKVDRMKKSKHVTIKYRAGDIFRIEIDRFHYCYGIITGEVSKIRKWKEIPERHSLHSLMMVPIMVRYYNQLTTNPDLSIEELEEMPLSRVDICGDNDIIWGTHQIVGHKQLKESDLEFNLVCSKYINKNKHCTVFTQDSMIHDKLISMPEEYQLHIEWGTAVTALSSNQISEKLREFLKDYHSPHGGVSMGIYPDLLMTSEEVRMQRPAYKFNLLEDINREIRNELFSCLGLTEDATLNEFADKFGGLTKKEILEKINI